MYFDKECSRGYNVYLKMGENDHATGMDVALLVMESGDTHTFDEAEKEIAIDLLQGKVEFAWDGQICEADRPDTFHYDAYCLHVCKGTKVTVTARNHAELYVQMTDNERTFESRMYTADNMLLQQAGKNGELMGCMRREIKTFFDYESAPYSNMVLGEVMNDRGNWSGYLPHRHPQPELYYFKFDRPEGFGASFVGDDVFKSVDNSFSAIPGGRLHPQSAAPGYLMYTCWMIRHLPGNPWLQTDRCEDEAYVWLHEAKIVNQPW